MSHSLKDIFSCTLIILIILIGLVFIPFGYGVGVHEEVSDRNLHLLSFRNNDDIASYNYLKEIKDVNKEYLLEKIIKVLQNKKGLYLEEYGGK